MWEPEICSEFTKKGSAPSDLWKPEEMARFLGIGRDGLLYASPIKRVSP